MSEELLVLYLLGTLVTFGVSGIVYLVSQKTGWQARKRAHIFLLIAGGGALFTLPILKYNTLHFFTDFAHWMSVLWSIAQSGVPASLSHEFIIPGTLNYFSVHFVPFIYLFAVPFKLISRPETLMVFNVALMLSAAIPLYKLALHHFVPPLRVRGGEEGLRSYQAHLFGLFVAALLLWYPTFQYITLYEFEMLRFSIPILFWMLYFFEIRRTLLYLLFVVLAILVREEMGLTVAMFGLYAWIFQKRRWEGVAAVALGLGGFVLITSMVMPIFSSGEYTHVAAGSFAQFGSTPLEVLRGVATHPLVAVQTVFNPIKLANLFMLGLPLLFIPLAAASALLGAVANIGIGLLSEGVIHTSYMLYYVAPSVPFIFYAFLKAWPKVIRWLPSPSPLPKGEGGRRTGEGALMAALLAGVVASNIFFGPSPISLQFWFKNIRPAPFRTQDFHWSVYRVTDHHRKVNEFVRIIPDSAIVSTQEFLMPRLYRKRGVMKFPQLEAGDGKHRAEYVFIDRTNNGLKPDSPAYISAEAIDAVVGDSDVWGRVADEDGYELYKIMEPNGE